MLASESCLEGGAGGVGPAPPPTLPTVDGALLPPAAAAAALPFPPADGADPN